MRGMAVMLFLCTCIQCFRLVPSVLGQKSQTTTLTVLRHFTRRNDILYTRRLLFSVKSVRVVVDLYRHFIEFPSVTVLNTTASRQQDLNESDVPDVFVGDGVEGLIYAVAFFWDSKLDVEIVLTTKKADSFVLRCADAVDARYLPTAKSVIPYCRIETSASYYLGELLGIKSLEKQPWGNRSTALGPGETGVLDLSNSSEKGRGSKAPPHPGDPVGLSCTLHLVADHLFVKHYASGDIVKAVVAMTTAVLHADTFFRAVDFNGDSRGDNIGFEVSNISVVTCPPADYPLGGESMPVESYLEAFSAYNFSDVCLGVGFTFREFADGIVGLAWMATSLQFGMAGGICQGRAYSEWPQRVQSLNSLVITGRSKGHRLPLLNIATTLIHEFGHSFGSSHDDIAMEQCSPKSGFGKYLMHAFSTMATYPNNLMFSPCSLEQIQGVIAKSRGCLKPLKTSKCGNFITEAGEACDCGPEITCQNTDPCCIPPGREGQCGLKAGAVCSPAEFDCCSTSCSIIPASDNHLCSKATECRAAVYCDGVTLTCPSPRPYPDGTVCDGGRMVCHGGECSKDVCQSKGFQLCSCTDSLRDLCKLCCRRANSTECSPAATFGLPGTGSEELFLHHGSACDMGRGFCSEHLCVSDFPIMDRIALAMIPPSQGGAGTWFSYWWVYIFVLGSLAAFLTGLLHVLGRRHADYHDHARRMGQLSAMVIQARAVENKLEAATEEVLTEMDTVICAESNFLESMDLAEASGRLAAFFPSATEKELIQIVNMSSTEDVAVVLLLTRGHSMLAYL